MTDKEVLPGDTESPFMAKEVMTGRLAAAPVEAGVPGTMLVTVWKEEAAGEELDIVLDEVDVAGEGEHDDVEEIAIFFRRRLLLRRF